MKHSTLKSTSHSALGLQRDGKMGGRAVISRSASASSLPVMALQFPYGRQEDQTAITVSECLHQWVTANYL